MAELESGLQRRCQAVLKKKKAFVIKTHGDIYGRVGIPDLIGCLPIEKDRLLELMNEDWFKSGKIGLFVSFEIKRENHLKDVSKAQEIVGKEIKDAGGLWFAIDDSELLEYLLDKLRGEQDVIQ